MRLGNVYADNMTINDNSVNIKKRDSTYHHGDLRLALVEAGMALLATRQVDDISLREVARMAGVSATAVYRHFPDKQALLKALCGRGLEQLAVAQQQALDAAGGGVAGFDAMGQAYVRFALTHPALFRLIMSTMPASGYFAEDEATVNPAMRGLRRNIAAIMPPGANPEKRRIAAIHAWSLVHGMALLMLDGQIPADEAIIASLSRTVLSGGPA
jgi:AcrR family transcriptional regulator